ncbi:hypothetical protein SAMN06298216_0913 [Spirosomataceae bacterium TFI 002]|nr:hypothetical protein SAMN06298216_0913 [Spirosomataceae bacterium TFI 002]
MNYSEVKKELKKEFESFLKPLGYKSKTDPQGCDFGKLSINSLNRIGYGVANYIDEFNTSCYLKICNEQIQNIEGEIFEEKGIYDTLSTGMATYFNEINYRYKIKSQEDIIEWGKIVRKFYEEYAVPFFEKYNSLDAIDKLLNDHPTEKVIYLDDLGWRIIKGLIVAKLINNPKYNELRVYYKSEVESKFQGYFMYEKCMKTIDFLETHSQEELIKISEA